MSKEDRRELQGSRRAGPESESFPARHPSTDQPTDRPTSRTERGAQRKKEVISLCSPLFAQPPLLPSLPSPMLSLPIPVFPVITSYWIMKQKDVFLTPPSHPRAAGKEAPVPEEKQRTPSQKEKTPPPHLDVKESPFPLPRSLRASSPPRKKQNPTIVSPICTLRSQTRAQVPERPVAVPHPPCSLPPPSLLLLPVFLFLLPVVPAKRGK